jgi:hypothetical protein
MNLRDEVGDVIDRVEVVRDGEDGENGGHSQLWTSAAAADRSSPKKSFSHSLGSCFSLTNGS